VYSSYVLTYVHLVPPDTGSVDNVSICRMDKHPVPSDRVFMRVVSRSSFRLMQAVIQWVKGGSSSIQYQVDNALLVVLVCLCVHFK